MGEFSNKRAFIVRPFAPRSGVDFQEVEKQLIAPALAQLDIQGGTTELFLEAGNIREDMFQQLLVADIVIADVSVHNANVFYELGIRHALRPKHTYLLRARIDKPRNERTPEDDVPFDIRTDRYLEYDPKEPAAQLQSLMDGLKRTLSQEKPADSPVFLMLPGLESQDHSRFLAVPQSFGEEVALAAKCPGRLGLLAMEAGRFPWVVGGLRMVGRAQFELQAGAEAKRIWEQLLERDRSDVEANHKLGMINRRLANGLPREASNNTSGNRGTAGELRAIESQQTREGHPMVLGLDPINDIHRMEPVETPSSPLPPASQSAGHERQVAPESQKRWELLEAANQALRRVVNNRAASCPDRAEAMSLLGSNIQDRWVSVWGGLEGLAAAKEALRSPEHDLLKAYEKFKQAFYEDLNSFLPGVNALALLTLTVELANKLPEVWESRFSEEESPAGELRALEQQRLELAGAVKSSLDAARKRMEKNDERDWRVEIGRADFQFLTRKSSRNLAFSYSAALSGAAELRADDARERLEIFQKLDVFRADAEKALDVFPPAAVPVPPAGRVILFTGQTLDPKQFPDWVQEQARKEIRTKVLRERGRTEGRTIGIASLANGGDLLFHEVCEEIGIDHRLYLPVPQDRSRTRFVSLGLEEWAERFDALLRKDPSPPCLAESTELPVWLTTKDYSVWQRANLWLIYEALALGAKNLTLLALWDGVGSQGLGDINHMMTVAQRYGAAILPVYTTDLLRTDSASPTSS
jgi:hypothetical protein